MAAVSIDGVGIDRIVKKVKFDIAELQRRVDEADGLDFSDELIDSVVAKVIASLDTAQTYATNDEFVEVKTATALDLVNMRNDFYDKLNVMEKVMRQDFEAKLGAMQTTYDAQLTDAMRKLSYHQEVIDKHAGQLAEVSVRIDGVEERTSALKKHLLKKHNDLHVELLAVMEVKINDTFHLVDARLNKLDKDVFEAISRHTEALATFDTQMLSSNARVTAVEQTYCTQTELVQKADITSLSLKADTTETEEIRGHVQGTMRKLDALADATKAAQTNLEKALVDRTDRKAEWILRTLRKELREKDTTDIGKVRCLVCDQPVPQKDTAETSVFGGAPLKPTVHPQGKTRALTDDAGHEEKHGDRERADSPGDQRHGITSYRRDPPRVRPQNASEEPSYQYNRKLVSLTAAPTNNILTAILKEQQQRLSEVFEEENSVYSGDYGNTRRAMQSAPKQEYPPPVGGTRGGSARGSRGAGKLSSDYFSELENKYAHTTTGRSNPLLAARQRPGSAPAWKARR